MATRLPKDPLDRTTEIVRRSLPRPGVPDDCHDLPDTAVRYRHEARNERAAMYASMEDLTDRIASTAENVVSSGVVLDIVRPDEEDSLVQSLDSLEDSLDVDDAVFVVPLYATAH